MLKCEDKKELRKTFGTGIVGDKQWRTSARTTRDDDDDDDVFTR